MKRRRILIFSVSFGNGHNQVSNCLLNHLKARGFDVEIIDTFEIINRLFHKIILEGYLTLLRYQPRVWGKLYQYSEKKPNSFFFQHSNTFITSKIQYILRKKQASTIITTHPIATTLIANTIRKSKLDVQLYALLTDFAVHPMSIHPEVRGYFIASEHLRYYAKLYNLDEKIFFATGIPTLKENFQNFTKRQWRKKLHLQKNMKTVLIAGGGVGLAKFTKILAALEVFDERLQIICVTAENKRAKQRLERSQSKHLIRVLGYTNLFMEYLKASDVIITKSGGVTMSEALVCATPVLIFQPLPGQEEQNSQFLMNYGAAIKAEIVEEIPVLLKRIIFNSHYHQLMTENARKLKEPNAASEISEIISRDFRNDVEDLTV